MPFAIGVLMILGGIGIIVHSLRNAAAARAATDWPTAPCEILLSEVTQIGASRRSYGCNIHYRYHVNGNSYDSDRVSFFGIHTRDEATSFTDQFAEGTEHRAYYSPESPEFAVLVPGVYGKNRTHTVAMGAIVMLTGVGVLFAGS